MPTSATAAVMMLAFFILCHIAPSGLIRSFTSDPSAIAIGDEYLRIISWNFVASGIMFVAGSMFQAMGNTFPSIATSLVRIIVVAIPVFVLARSPGFELATIWQLGVISVFVQLALGLALLRREFSLRLRFADGDATPHTVGVGSGMVAIAE